MYTLKYILQQHTPLIHFQTSQDNAGLRTTELKPKFDKYIVSRFIEEEKINFESNIMNDSKKLYTKVKELFDFKDKSIINKLSHDGVLSLNYKLQIKSVNFNFEVGKDIEYEYTSNKGNVMQDKFPCYFGSMGLDNQGSKEFVMYKDIILLVTTQSNSVKNLIEKYISKFFATHCFGTRQSKGFGSFTLSTDENLDLNYKYWFDIDIKTNKLNNLNYSYPPKEAYLKQKYLFYVINLFYSSMRSGINQMGGGSTIYFKSLLFQYFKQKGIQWDKRTIKERFYFDRLKEQMNKYSGSDIVHFTTPELNKKIVRDVFGLASESQWKDYPTQGFKDTIKKEFIRAKDNDIKIERFKSPLRFKPFLLTENNYRVYFTFDTSDLIKILGSTFKISIDKTKKEFNLSFPDAFDFNDFIHFIANKNLIQETIKYKTNNRENNEAKILIDIYGQLEGKMKN